MFRDWSVENVNLCSMVTFDGIFEKTTNTKKREKMDGSGENHSADMRGNAGSLPDIKTAITAYPLYSTALAKEYPGPFAD